MTLKKWCSLAFINKIFVEAWFDSEKIKFNDVNTEKLLDIEYNQLSLKIERLMYEGSNWTINSKSQYQLVI